MMISMMTKQTPLYLALCRKSGEQMIVINIALIILGILYGVGSVTNFKEWYYRHDYLAIALSVFTSILLVVAGILNVLN